MTRKEEDLNNAIEIIEERFPGFTELTQLISDYKRANNLLMGYVKARKNGESHKTAIRPLLKTEKTTFLSKWRDL